jgi:hypothetical protein
MSGIIGGAGSKSGVITPKIMGTTAFSVSVPNNTTYTIFDMSTVMGEGDLAFVMLTAPGFQVGVVLHIQRDSTGYVLINGIPQRIGYVASAAMSGSSLQINTSLSAGNNTIKGRIVVMKGY